MTNPTNPKGHEIETAPNSRAPATEPGDFWSEVDRLFREFQDGFYSSLRSPSLGAGSLGRSVGFAPALADVADKGRAFEITADLPGVPKDQIDVRVVGNTVQIEAQHASEAQEESRTFLRRERVWSGFHRQIELPEPVRSENVTARYENGVLVVTVPKAQPTVETKVAVQ
jgi:HSP20 family protein